MKFITRVIPVVCLILCNNLPGIAQEIPLPEGYVMIDTATGDLDKDGVAELVVAYNTRKENGDDFDDIPRALIIYKKHQQDWIAWKQSHQALYSSRGGGMMGDPFGEMYIKNRLLLISHNGGSSWKWTHTDKYRYQDGDFYLVGYTSNYGKLCEYWTNVDYDLSTGNMIVKKEYEKCEDEDQKIYKRENETLVKKGLKITLGKRNEQDITVVTPKYGHEIYIAIKLEE